MQKTTYLLFIFSSTLSWSDKKFPFQECWKQKFYFQILLRRTTSQLLLQTISSNSKLAVHVFWQPDCKKICLWPHKDYRDCQERPCPQLHKEVVQNCRTKPFSLACDESNDRNSEKTFAILVRYFDNQAVIRYLTNLNKFLCKFFVYRFYIEYPFFLYLLSWP